MCDWVVFLGLFLEVSPTLFSLPQFIAILTGHYVFFCRQPEQAQEGETWTE